MEKTILLSKWRKFLGLNQEEFARKICKSTRTISNWETGKTEYPTDWIAKELEVSIEEFLAGPPTRSIRNKMEPESGSVPVSKSNVQKYIAPESMIRLYMLSEIRANLRDSKIEGVTYPESFLLPNNDDFFMVRVDSGDLIGDRILISENDQPDNKSYVLVWDSDDQKAEIILHAKSKKSHKVLGVAININKGRK